MNGELELAWRMVSAALSTLLLPGFLCLEAGLVRRRNAVNAAVKAVVSSLVAFGACQVVGWSLVHGPSLGGWLGMVTSSSLDLPPEAWPELLRESVMAAAAAAIVSGALAERLRFLPFALSTTVCAGLFIPLFGHWVRGGGWLASMGFQDGAGGAGLHLLSAGFALAGLIRLGRRRLRLGGDGRHEPPAPNDLVLASLGSFLLLLGWIGFQSGASSFHDAGRVAAATLSLSTFGGLAALLVGWSIGGLARLELVLVGMLGGIACGAASILVAPLAIAPMLGLLGGLLAAMGSMAIRRLGWDDAVGALPAHGLGGLVGTLVGPVWLGGEWGATLVGIAASLVLGLVGGAAFWWALGALVRLRGSADEEAVGLDFTEHRVAAGLDAADASSTSLP